MGRRQMDKRRKRTIMKNNTGTYMVSLPVEFMRVLGWTQGQEITVKRRGETLLLELDQDQDQEQDQGSS